MAISKYSRSIQMPQYTPRSIEEYMMVPKASTEALIGSQEALSNMLFDKNLLPQDKAKLKEIIDPFNQRIESLSEKVAKGDISANTMMDLGSLSSDYKRLVSPTGTYGFAAANYTAAMDYLKNAAETYDQDPLIAQAAAQDYINAFSTYGDEGFNNGVAFVGNAMPSFVDTQEYVTNLAKNVSADKFAVYLDAQGQAMLQQPGMNYTLYDLLGHIEEKNKSKIQNLIFGMASSDPDFVRSYDFQMKYRGMPGLFTTIKDKNGEEKVTLNPATPFYRMTEALSKGASSRKESFIDATPTQTSPSDLSLGVTAQPPQAEVSKFNTLSIFGDNLTVLETYKASTDAAVEQVSKDPRAGDLQSIIKSDGNIFDFENSSANTNAARQNFYDGIYQLTQDLAKGLTPDQAYQGFAKRNPNVDIESFKEFMNTGNNADYVLQVTQALSNKETAILDRNLYDASVEEEYKRITKSFGSEDKFYNELQIPTAKSRRTPLRIAEYNIKEEFMKREEQIFVDNLPILISGGEKAYKDAILSDYNTLKNDIIKDTEATIARTTNEKQKSILRETLNRFKNYDLETGAVGNMADRIGRNFKKKVYENETINQSIDESYISYDFPENDEITQRKQGLLKRILDNKATFPTVNGKTLKYALDELGNKINENISADIDNYDLHIIPKGGKNYVQVVYNQAAGQSIAFTMDLDNVAQADVVQLITAIVDDPEMAKVAQNNEAGRLVLLNHALGTKGKIGLYNTLRNPTADTKNIPYTLGLAGQGNIELIRNSNGKVTSYKVTNPSGETKVWNTPEEVVTSILF